MVNITKLFFYAENELILTRRVKIAKKWPFGGKKKDSTEMYTNDTSGYVE